MIVCNWTTKASFLGVQHLQLTPKIVFKITTKKSSSWRAILARKTPLFCLQVAISPLWRELKKVNFLHTKPHSAQNFHIFFVFFCLESLFCKHAKFSKVNAFWKFGVDFFQPSAAFFRQNCHKHLFTSHLAKVFKIRLFSAKNFLAQNFQKFERVECSFSEQN